MSQSPHDNFQVQLDALLRQAEDEHQYLVATLSHALAILHDAKAQGTHEAINYLLGVLRQRQAPVGAEPSWGPQTH